MEKHKKKGMLKILMLSIIIRKSRVHGYEVYKELLEMGKHMWRPSIGTIYRVLNGMVAEGLIDKEEKSVGGRTIVYYSPTKQGINEFIERSRVFLERIYLGLNLLTSTLQNLKKSNVVDEDLEFKVKRIYELVKNYYASVGH